MPLYDAELSGIVVAAFNENKQISLNGSERIDWLCKKIASTTYRLWASRTACGPMKDDKYAPLIIVSLHMTEPPSAIAGEHFYKYGNKTDERWRAYEFKLPDCGWYILIKFGD